MKRHDPKAPGLIDILVGRWLRTLRFASNMSREEVAFQAGLTPQQIQKYESGYNRIAAGRLGHLSIILGVSVDDFYRGADILVEALAHLDGADLPAGEFGRDLCDLLIAYIQAGSSTARKDILELVRSRGGKQLKDRSSVAFVVREESSTSTLH